MVIETIRGVRLKKLEIGEKKQKQKQSNFGASYSELELITVV